MKEEGKTRTPTLGGGLRDAGSERGGVHDPVRRVGGRAGFSDDELGLVDACGDDLEERGVGEDGGGGGQEARAVGVFRRALCGWIMSVLVLRSASAGRRGERTVVELDVVPVDQVSDGLVDRAVRAAREERVGREPRCERRVRQDELALGQRRPERRRERRKPRLGAPVAEVHRREVLVVDVDPVEVEGRHELRHRRRGRRGVEALRRRELRRAEGGDDERDPGVLVRRLGGCALGGGQHRPLVCFVRGARREQEGECAGRSGESVLRKNICEERRWGVQDVEPGDGGRVRGTLGAGDELVAVEQEARGGGHGGCSACLRRGFDRGSSDCVHRGQRRQDGNSGGKRESEHLVAWTK